MRMQGGTAARLKLLKEMLVKQPKLAVAGGCVGLFLGGWILYGPALSSVREATRTWNQLRQEVEGDRKVLDPFRKGELFLLPTSDELPAVLKALNETARSRQVQLLEVSPQPTHPGETAGLIILPVELRLEGGYRAIGEFLGALRSERGLGMVCVTRINIDREERLLPRLRARASLEIFLGEPLHGS